MQYNPYIAAYRLILMNGLRV